MGRLPTGDKPKKPLNVSISQELRTRINEISKETRLPITAMIESALESIADYYDQHGEITLPLAAVPRRHVEHLLPEKKREAG